LAALEPQSCDVLAIRYALNRRCQWGLPAFSYPGQAISRNRRLSHAARKLREILLTIDVRVSGRCSSGL
jgi:hypothetical protein